MGKKILIIDDEPQIISLLKRPLTEKGYEVITASHGLEGVTLAKNENPDLIITDLMMPKVDGHGVCQLLKSDESYANVPILVMTASLDEEDKKWAQKTGANGFINKPFIVKDVLALIEKFLTTTEN